MALTEPLDGGLGAPADGSPRRRASCPSPAEGRITEHEFSCHCCYDILVNPTTLTCGHNFCRHCLAQWWESSHKNECPECREKWEGFPKVNILLRDATEELFGEIVRQRREGLQANPKISRSLLAFQRYGDNLGRCRTNQYKGAGLFFSGVLTALICVFVTVMLFHWSSGAVEQHDPLLSKPVSLWTAVEVMTWLENLGPWAQLYRDAFLQESVNGRLLLMLGDEELMKAPFNVQNQAHRRAVLAELDRIRVLGVKAPQNLWEYKAANAGKSLFLLYALKRSPRLTILYLYLFDYADTFLPFLHTCCPAAAPAGPLLSQLEPTWRQWEEFLLKLLLLPYQLIAEFAWDWLDVHYWTPRFVIANAVLLSLLEGCSLRSLWSAARIRNIPSQMWSHMWRMLSQGFAFALLWPLVPHFVSNGFFYWALYCSPVINVYLLVKQLMNPETQAAA